MLGKSTKMKITSLKAFGGMKVERTKYRRNPETLNDQDHSVIRFR